MRCRTRRTVASAGAVGLPGSRTGPPGAALTAAGALRPSAVGLAVARGFTEAVGGTLGAEDTPRRWPDHGPHPRGGRQRTGRRGTPELGGHMTSVRQRRCRWDRLPCVP